MTDSIPIPNSNSDSIPNLIPNSNLESDSKQILNQVYQNLTLNKNEIIYHNYKEISKDFSPFDAVFFSGSDTVSQFIKIAEHFGNSQDAPFSHIGMLINSEIFPELDILVPGAWYVFESTSS